jgi:flagellar M-ring protein FliF
MDQLKAILRAALKNIGAFRASNRQLFNLIVGAVALATLICGALYIVNPGAPVVLAANLAPADRTALALRLRRHKIDFTLGTDSITVPEREFNEAQRVLDGSPGFSGGGEDFSLFDRSTMGQSDFDEQVNYQRSLQGELERTIMNLRGVESARVMLALGRPSPFALGTSDADRASVMLTTSPGAVMDATMASAIAHLVASSVRGLDAESVTVTGNDGAILYPPQHQGELGDAIQLRNDFEHRLEEKVSGLLGRIMGDNRYAVEVAVDVDTSRVTSRDELYGKGDQTILSEEHSVTPGGSVPGGIPGLTSNLPAPSPNASPAAEASPGVNDKPVSIQSQSQNADMARKDIVNYKPSSHEIDTVTSPVRIKRISVAAVLDGTYEGGKFRPLPDDRLHAIQGLVAAAVGAEVDRGDSVDIQSAALSQPYIPPVRNPLDQLRSLFSDPMHMYIALGAALVIFVFVLWMFKRMLSKLFGGQRVEKTVSPSHAEAAIAEPRPSLKRQHQPRRSSRSAPSTKKSASRSTKK